MSLRRPRWPSPAVGMAAGTTLSRLTGLARTVLLASVLGVTALGDAYNIANTLPNIIFQLAAGGVLSATVVPLLARADSEDQRRETAGILLGTLTIVGIAATLLLLVAAPFVVRLLTIGGTSLPDHDAVVRTGTTWLRMFAPQVALYTVSVLATAIMTARHRLALGAFAAVSTNVLVIAGALAFDAMVDGEVRIDALASGPIATLGWATTAGVATMALLQLWGAYRAEPGIRARVALHHPAIRQLRHVGGWVLVYVAVNQLGLAAVVALASSVEGGVSAYQWAFALMQLPYAIVAVSVVSDAFPRIAKAAARDADVTEEVARPLRRMLLILLPAGMGLAVLALPAARTVVGPTGSVLVAAALGGFALSLVPFSIFQLLTRTSYASQDTRTPALVNIVLNLVTVGWGAAIIVAIDSGAGRLVGLALGDAAAYAVGCVLLRRRLVARGTLRAHELLGPSFGRSLVATGSMGFALAVVLRLAGVSGSQWGAAMQTVVLAGLGVISYMALCCVLGVRDLGQLRIGGRAPS
jgi:putative peptidoglycan lipid II flippase